jgi:hypothetical protein
MEVKRTLQACLSLNALAIPEPVWQKPEALKVGEYY